MGIRGKLFLGFSLIIAIFTLATGVLLLRITSSENSAGIVINSDLPVYDALRDSGTQIYLYRSGLEGYMATQDTVFKKEITDASSNIAADQTLVDRLSVRWKNDDISSWNKVKLGLEDLKAIQSKIENAADSKNIDLANSLFSTEFLPRFNGVLDVLDGPLDANGVRTGGLFDRTYVSLVNGSQSILSNMDVIRVIEYLFLALSIAASAVTAIVTSRKILTPLNNAIDIAAKISEGERKIDIKVVSNDETGVLLSSLAIMQEAIEKNEEKLRKSEAATRELFDKIVRTANAFSSHSAKVALGDLTQRISIEPGSEMKELGTDLNTMTDSLATVARQITEACHGMVSALSEVRHSVDVQSTGATEQASSINEITASLEEIEKSSTQTIEKAKTLGSVAERTREKGQQGLDAVGQSIAGMQLVREKVQAIAQTILDLSNQTQQVGEITAVVNGLAQQSKMLALNASIEAAKAGEAGKGFAVVASEVKNLSEQSEQSTSQVQKILEDIRRATEKAVMATEEGTKGVDIGTGLVEQTGEIVKSLSAVIHETTVATQQIEAAIRQENVGIEQITAGMNEINQVTTAFVENVRQTTEAIDNIAGIADSLKEHVDIYKI